eukprot:scaffold45288_cov65-Cyclotella_meneghiniana.AAC.1
MAGRRNRTAHPDQGMPVVKKSAACMTVDCQSYGSRQGSETTDWQAPASRTMCPTPGWPRLHAQAQNEATLRLATGDWITTGIPWSQVDHDL